MTEILWVLPGNFKQIFWLI